MALDCHQECELFHLSCECTHTVLFSYGPLSFGTYWPKGPPLLETKFNILDTLDTRVALHTGPTQTISLQYTGTGQHFFGKSDQNLR